MKKKVIYFSLFTTIVLITYFLISSISYSNLRFKTYYTNLESYSGEDKQDFFLNYYLTTDDNIIYFDYRTKNTILKELNTKTGEKTTLISLKEYGDYNISFSFKESLDYYNILSDSRLLRYNKTTYQIQQLTIENTYNYLFDPYSNNYYLVSENYFFDENKVLLYSTNFTIDKCYYLSNQVFFTTSYNNEAFIIDIASKQSYKIGTHHLTYTYDENGVYLTARKNGKLCISSFDLTGFLTNYFEIDQFDIYSNFTRNGYLYYLSKTEDVGNLKIINLNNKKLSETVKISKQENTLINFDNLLITSKNKLFLGNRTTKFDFELDENKTTQNILYFN